MTRALLSLSAVCGLAAAAHAQSFTADSTFSMPMRWIEANTSGIPLPNPNGVLEPGEHALITFHVEISNQFHTAAFSPAIGTFTSGTILGMGGGWIDIVGSGGTHGSFNINNPPTNGT